MIPLRNGCNVIINSCSLILISQFSMLINSLSARFTSSMDNKPSVYFVQCLFKGELSLRLFAATINAERKIRCLVVSIPMALAGK